MPRDFTGVGAARFNEPATLVWGEPIEVESATVLRLFLRAGKVSGSDGVTAAGLVCFDETDTQVGAMLDISLTLNDDTNWQNADQLFQDFPAGTAYVHLVWQLSTTGSEVEVDEFSWEDVTESERASGFADASATSASNASVSETEAGQSAAAAIEAKTAAETARGSAETAATQAATSETNAAGSASAAGTFASNAATSANEAGDSATAASSSASTATTKATEASQNAAAAESSKTLAETAKGQAETAAGQASTSESNATGSANAAALSASAAATSANEAGDSATAAATSASSASTKADEATQSATAANSAKTAAETAQGSAETAAANAATSETNADGSASAAATSASNAATSENNAGDSATAASNSASTATTKATEAELSATSATESSNTATTAALVAATNAAVSGPSILAAPFEQWTNLSANVQPEILKPAPTTGVFRLNDGSFGTCYEFEPDANQTIGPAFPYAWDDDAVYEVKVTLKTVFGGALPVSWRIGATIQLGTTVLVNNVQTAPYSTAAFDGVQTRTAWFGKRPLASMPPIPSGIDYVELPSSAAGGSKFYPHVRQIGVPEDEGYLRVGTVEVRNVTPFVDTLGSANAAAQSASVAQASNTAAGESATAALTAKTAAETARGQAQTARTEAVQARDDAQGASATAVSASELSVTVRDGMLSLGGNPDFAVGAAGWHVAQPWNIDQSSMGPMPESHIINAASFSGGKAARFTGDHAIATAIPIPNKNNNATYRFKLRLRCRDINGNYPSTIWCGAWTGSGVDREWFVLSNHTLPSDNVWHEFEVDHQFGNAVNYFRPVLILNYEDPTGLAVVDVDYFDFDDVTDLREVSAAVTTQASAIADLQGNASAGYLIRAQAGNAVSLLDLVAADGASGPVSIAKLSADQIILDGTVTAAHADFESLSALGLTVTNADIVGDLKSSNFVAGSDGWRIRPGGVAEFNNVIIRRQIAIDSGFFTLPNSIDGGNTDGYQIKQTVYIETNVNADAWSAPERTYMAAVGKRPGSGYGVVAADSQQVNTDPDSVRWGYDAQVVNLTKWAGPQRLFIKVEVICRHIISMTNFQLEWKLYEVS